MELTTSDGVRLAGRRWPARGPARGTVILVHGFGASAAETKVVAIADAIADHGFDVLSYDSRGHGASGGEATLGDLEQLDVAAAVNAGGGAGPVLLVGASMGAIAALRFAAGSPGTVIGVVTVSCPARWQLPRNARGVLSAVLTQTSLGRAFARKQAGVRIAPRGARAVPPVELVRSVGVPLTVVHGRADPFIGVDAAEALYGAAGEPRRIELVAGLGHGFAPAAIAPILTGLDWCVAPPEPTPLRPATT